MQFERGYKSWCENISIQYRKEISLKPYMPLCPWMLAKRLHTLVWTLDDLTDLPDQSKKQLLNDHTSWDAANICVNSSNLIILNQESSKERQSSTLMHELSHIILNHEPSRVDISTDNLIILDSYDKGQEDEANWLAGTLLLPRQSLIHIVENFSEFDPIRIKYMVSKEMLRYRINMTGIGKQYKNSIGHLL